MVGCQECIGRSSCAGGAEAEERAHGPDPGHRRRGRTHGRRRASAAARALPAGAAGQGRHAGRLRHQQLRRLHRRCSTARRVKSCSVLAVQADGAAVTTIEGLANGEWHPVQKAFKECHALQCGYCTPGMIMAAVDLLKENPNPSEEEIRDGLEGNLCRCTGYHNIVKAVQYAQAAASRRRRGGGPVTAIERTPGRQSSSASRCAARRTRRLVTGRTRWTDNVTLPGLLHVAVLRSPDGARPGRPGSTCRPRWPAAGRGRGLHRRGPRRRPGQPADGLDGQRGHEGPPHLPIATDKVRYVGDAVAVVVATDRYAAADALEADRGRLRAAAAVLDMEAALADGVAAGPRRHRHEPLLHLRRAVRRLRGHQGARPRSSASAATSTSG